MKKLSLILALMAGCMLPLTAVAQDSSSSKSKSKRKKASSSKEDKKKAEASKKEETASSTEAKVGGKLSDEQLMLNNQAVAAVKNNEFKKAEQLYQALLQLGEFNYIWYQLGRTYARQDKCVEAYDAYSHVATAPILDPEEYNPEMIRDATQKGVTELDAQCSAKVVFTCDPEEMTLSIDGGVEFDCSSKPVPLVPGRHNVYAKTSFGFNSIVVEAIAGQVSNSKVDVINYEEVAANAGVTEEELTRRSKLFKILGYTFIGSGAAIAAGGGAFWGVTLSGYRDVYKQVKEEGKQNDKAFTYGEYDYNKFKKYKDDTALYQNIGIAMVAAGSAIAVTGIVLVIYDAVKIQPQLQELTRGRSFNLSPVVSPDFSGFAFTGSF